LRRSGASLVGVVLLFLSMGAHGGGCTNCDCYHFPVPETCERCCGVATGTITAVTRSSVALAKSHGGVEKTFALTPQTKKNAALEPGKKATVYYRKPADVAAAVDLTDALSGLLTPGREPDPPSPCHMPVPPQALKVYLGNSLTWLTGENETILRIHGEDILTLRRTDRGAAISARVLSADGKVVAELIDNRFYVNPNNYFRVVRPDEHSLIVYGPEGRKALNIRFLNPSSFKLLGTFGYPGYSPFIIGEEEQTIRGFTSTRNCFGGAWATMLDVR